MVTENEYRYMSLLSRKILLQLSQGQKPFLIAKVCLSNDNVTRLSEMIAKESRPLMLSLDNDPEVQEILTTLKQKKVKVAGVIKGYLKQCIAIVQTPAEEWIPNPTEVDFMFIKYYEIPAGAGVVQPQTTVRPEPPIVHAAPYDKETKISDPTPAVSTTAASSASIIENKALLTAPAEKKPKKKKPRTAPPGPGGREY